MARPAETYRFARREAFKRDGGIWFECLVSGSNWRQPFDPSYIKNRPVLKRGWDYSKGDRAKYLSVKDQYDYMKKAYWRLGRGA